MTLFRCFLAVELPSAMQDAIRAATVGIRAALGPDLVRWVALRNVHLTLKFLGDTAPSGIELIRAALDAAVPHYKTFDVAVQDVGAFPNGRRPRVLWFGLDAPPPLISLQRELDLATARLGYSLEERGFSPHLTIGRVRQPAGAADLQKIREVLGHNRSVGELGTFSVGAVHLFKSELLPAGSVHTKLCTAQLAPG
ncbi:MAG TPA: RNA 2',3'-cyclic phosphodiesterase [Anaerolineales bacterium]|nr:RNA 2',3'-cyclic phosphodiesterase [Anaerolineales bacterium]